MIGILLLIIAICCYFRPRSRWISYFLYISFMLSGFRLWTDEITGFKLKDLAVIYTFLISLYLVTIKRFRIPNFHFRKYYIGVIVFLCFSVLFSFIHYKIPLYYILQGSREYLLLFSLPILLRVRPKEFVKLIRSLYWITFITSIIYILQIPFGGALMPYDQEILKDASTGLVRLYNQPPLNDFFLILSFVHPKFFKKRLKISRFVFFAALICTLGRTQIITTFLAVGIAILFNGKISYLIKTTVVMSLLLLPFANIVVSRFGGGGTSEDLQVLMEDGANSLERTADGGTMTYRIAWLMERYFYLIDCPVSEQIFGLGLVTDSYPRVYSMYNFNLGIPNPETGKINQMDTPDIAYGNLISKWGFGGTIVYLAFVISMTIYLCSNRKNNKFALVAASQSILLFAVSFSSASLSVPANFTIYFLIISSILHNQNKKDKVKEQKHEGNTYRIRLGKPNA